MTRTERNQRTSARRRAGRCPRYRSPKTEICPVCGGGNYRNSRYCSSLCGVKGRARLKQSRPEANRGCVDVFDKDTLQAFWGTVQELI